MCADGLNDRGNDANTQGHSVLVSLGGRWSSSGFAAGDHIVSAAPERGLTCPRMPSGSA